MLSLVGDLMGPVWAGQHHLMLPNRICRLKFGHEPLLVAIIIGGDTIPHISTVQTDSVRRSYFVADMRGPLWTFLQHHIQHSRS